MKNKAKKLFLVCIISLTFILSFCAINFRNDRICLYLKNAVPQTHAIAWTGWEVPPIDDDPDPGRLPH